jgi:hypothetical protein
MAVTEEIYSKSFLSRTDQVDISRHGSAEWKDYQTISEEDEKIRNKLVEKFGFHYNSEGEIGEGFDGKIWYRWKIEDNVNSLKDDSKNAEYQTEVLVRKTGAENKICFLSDLEKFLIENNFKN